MALTRISLYGMRIFPVCCSKKQNGELRITGVDLLNQNRSIVRTASESYIEDSYTRVLQRFFLVSFMYNFRSFGKGMFPGRENRERGGRRYSS